MDPRFLKTYQEILHCLLPLSLSMQEKEEIDNAALLGSEYFPPNIFNYVLYGNKSTTASTHIVTKIKLENIIL